MPTIRFRAHGFVCAVLLHEVPDFSDTAYVKNKLTKSSASASPVRWLGFVCSAGARKLSWARPGKLIASAVTAGNGISGEWRELADHEYVLAMLVQIDVDTFGAFAVVDKTGLPIIRSETAPRLTVVTPPRRGSVLKFG